VAAPTCPTCGEAQKLTGHVVEGDIEVHCGSCGATFARGARRCQSCGRTGHVEAEQRMTRHPRGTLLAVVGVRAVPLCPVCDDEVLNAFQARRALVPDGYVSRFLVGDAEPTPIGALDQGPSTPSPESRTSSDQMRRPRRRDQPGHVARPVVAKPVRRTTTLTDPTVRQAIESFLARKGTEADSACLVLLGAHLGVSTRLSALDVPAKAQAVSEWFEQRWGKRRSSSNARPEALQTVVAVADYWRSQGWISTDLAERLR
jgi:hypothetical protein